MSWNPEWNQSKNKQFFRVKMYNGGSKIVYMCLEQAEYMKKCTGLDFQKI